MRRIQGVVTASVPKRTRGFLVGLKARNLAAGVPSVSEATGRFLYDAVRKSGARSILEIGTAHGYSTVWMAEALRGGATGWPSEAYKGGTASEGQPLRPTGIITIDFSKPSYEAAVANVKEAGFENALLDI